MGTNQKLKIFSLGHSESDIRHMMMRLRSLLSLDFYKMFYGRFIYIGQPIMIAIVCPIVNIFHEIFDEKL